MIYTSYFANIKKLPKGVVPVAICGGIPKWYNGLEYKKLAPEYNSFSEWKMTGDSEIFSKKYKELVLSKLNVTEVVCDLYKLSGGEDVCLICYEKTGSFCHRHLVSEWLENNSYSCKEIEFLEL